MKMLLRNNFNALLFSVALFHTLQVAKSARLFNGLERTGLAVPTLEQRDSTALPPNDEARLIHMLIGRYKGLGLARPVAETEKTLNVSLLFIVNEFHGIEELAGVMKLTATVVAQWQDDLLRWNPDDFNQLKAMPMRTKDVFLPTIVKDGNGGTQSSIFMSGSGQNDREVSSMVWVEHTGKVEAKVTNHFLTSCKLNLANFPFDDQTCMFTFKAWRFSDQRISLQQATGQEVSDHFGSSREVNINVNANWLMTSVSSEAVTLPGTHENYSAVCYTISTSRRSDYYIWNVIMPSVAMATLLLATFFMPFGPERSMFCITLVLTMNIFQQALMSKLPVTAEVIPYVRQSTTQVLLGILITIESSIVWWLAAKDKRMGVPTWLRYLVPKLRVKMQQERMSDEHEQINKQFEHNNKSQPVTVNLLQPKHQFADGRSSHKGSMLSLASHHHRLDELFNHPEVALTEEEFLIWGEWLEVAQLVDLIMLALTLGSMFILPIYFYRHRFI